MASLLSVIIPAYNADAFIEDTLRSIKNQSMSDFEAIIVDDGSTDKTRKIVKGFSRNDHRFVYHYQKNGGAASARNTGQDMTKGRYITFVDADDLLTPDAFEHLTAHAEKHDCDVVIGAKNKIRKASTPFMPTLFAKMVPAKPPKEIPGLRYHIAPHAKLFRREFLDRTGIRFFEGYTYEDFLHSTQVFTSDVKIGIVTALCYFYIFRDESISEGYTRPYNIKSRIKIETKIWDHLSHIKKQDAIFSNPMRTTFRSRLPRHIGRLSKSDDENQIQSFALLKDFCTQHKDFILTNSKSDHLLLYSAIIEKDFPTFLSISKASKMLKLETLADELNEKFKNTDHFKSAWIYRDRVVAVDFGLQGNRVAFNLTPTLSDTASIKVEMFGRDKDSVVQNAILTQHNVEKLLIDELPVTKELTTNIVKLIKETINTHPLLDFDETTPSNNYDIIKYSSSDIALSKSNVEAAGKPAFTIREVIKRDICIGCGACAVATDGKIKIEVNEKGMYAANLMNVEGLNAKDFIKADKVCPFSDAASNEDELGAPSSKILSMPINQNIGKYKALLAGRENDDTRLVGSSSGGLTSWLLKKLLESGRVDGVVHVGGGDEKEERMYDYRLSFSSSELDKHRKSIYYSTTLAKALAEVRKYPEKKFAIVGVPCFIKSARLLANADIELGNQLKYYVGIVCGHMKSSFFAEANAWQLGIEPDNLKKVDFRVKVPGKKSSQYNFSAEGKGEKTLEQARPSKVLGGSWGHGFFQPNACNFCDDVFAETADVVLGDAWLPKYADDWRGTNIVAIRNEELVNIFQAGANNTEISVDNISIDNIVKSQMGGLRHRRTGLAVRLQDDIDAGLNVPKKRVSPTHNGVPLWRIKLIRQRQKLSKQSFETYKNARQTGDLSQFLEPMKKDVAIYKYLEKHKYPDAKKGKRKYDVGLFGWHHQGNMGGVLTFFALHQILERIGLKILVVWRPSRTNINEGNKGNYNLLKNYYTYSESLPPERLHELRNLCEKFVTASDQLWAGKWVPFNPEYEFLGAGDATVDKISVATSFGGDGTELPLKGERREIISYLFNQMDHISVREPSGVDVLGSINVKATQILDPVFLCPQEIYSDIIKKAKINIKEKKYIFGYILDAEESVVDFGRNVVFKTRGAEKSYFMTTMQNSTAKIEKTAKWMAFDGLTFLADGDMADFVAAISKANFVFTDSFHGACMATIFHKPFICCPKGHRGNSRFALFKQLGLEDRILARDGLDADIINKPIDWEKVDKRLNEMREKSFNWLEMAFDRDFGAVSELVCENNK